MISASEAQRGKPVAKEDLDVIQQLLRSLDVSLGENKAKVLKLLDSNKQRRVFILWT